MLDQTDEDGEITFNVRIEYDTGYPRPTEGALSRLLVKLAGRQSAKSDVNLPERVEDSSVWAVSKQEANAEAESTIQQSRHHFEIYGIYRLGAENAIQVTIYPAPNSFPSKEELIRYVEKQRLPRRSLTIFYLPLMNTSLAPYALYRAGDRSSFKSYPTRLPPEYKKLRPQ